MLLWPILLVLLLMFAISFAIGAEPLLVVEHADAYMVLGSSCAATEILHWCEEAAGLWLRCLVIVLDLWFCIYQLRFLHVRLRLQLHLLMAS